MQSAGDAKQGRFQRKDEEAELFQNHRLYSLGKIHSEVSVPHCPVGA
jgi:hypothetical protein